MDLNLRIRANVGKDNSILKPHLVTETAYPDVQRVFVDELHFLHDSLHSLYFLDSLGNFFTWSEVSDVFFIAILVLGQVLGTEIIEIPYS